MDQYKAITMDTPESKHQNLERWRLMLGGEEADGTEHQLSDELTELDQTLSALYEFERKGSFDYNPNGKQLHRKGGKGKGTPSIARWLGDIRKYFPQSVVNVMQADAMKNDRLKEKMIMEPEILEKAEADVHLVASLMEMGKLIPEKTKETARMVVKKVVDELMDKLEQKTIASLSGALDKSTRSFRPRHNEINWPATIKKNLKHYQPEYKTIIPEVKVGYGKKSKRSLKDIILCLDQSGSMGESVIYSGIFGAVMASLPNVKTKMVVFDTQIADLTEELEDPVDLLFGVQLGGGTDINKALQYCESLVEKPDDTILVLVTDLCEGGDLQQMKKRALSLVESGVQVICLLALDDNGTPWYDKQNAKFFADNKIPVFACTPDLFPDMMAAAIQKNDITTWASENDIVLQ
ncbi:VWA domain-containing protein [Flammeovirga sp. EKP202]|uniref:vWA domain-containing protein n=1 Tax=Flammeovirga sp. EKP202 TaxID=2770592 RepID=UPI001CB81DCB|nr:VWA domain-containing protein [Flammeovirga sp. EKP202]